MKRFSCGDVVPGCTAVFEAPTNQDLFQAIAQHAQEGHGITEITPDLVAKIEPHIQDSSAA